MQLHSFVIGILIFSLVVVVGLTATSDMATNYAQMGITVNVDGSQSDAFDKAQSINEKAESIQNSVSGTDVGSSDSSSTFLGGAWNSIQIVFNSFSIAADSVKQFASLWHIPTVVVTFIITALALTIFFTAVYMLFNNSGK